MSFGSGWVFGLSVQVLMFARPDHDRKKPGNLMLSDFPTALIIALALSVPSIISACALDAALEARRIARSCMKTTKTRRTSM